MSREIEDQISAFADDELSSEECAFLVRRLERDNNSREKLLRYAVIGASLRGDLLGPNPELLRERLKQTLDGVSLVPAPAKAAPGWRSPLLRPLLGGAIAASAAVVGLMAVYNSGQVGLDNPSQTVAAEQVPANTAPAPSYVVPQEAPVTRAATESGMRPPARLTNYLVRHGEYAIGIGRTSIHSNVVSSRDVRQRVESEPTE